eukprot:scaffold133316_cov65-Phaeocystis_antarctica.AAC.2
MARCRGALSWRGARRDTHPAPQRGAGEMRRDATEITRGARTGAPERQDMPCGSHLRRGVGEASRAPI